MFCSSEYYNSGIVQHFSSLFITLLYVAKLMQELPKTGIAYSIQSGLAVAGSSVL